MKPTVVCSALVASLTLLPVSVPLVAGGLSAPPTVALEGVLRPSQTVKLGSSTVGVLAAVEVDRGDVVSAGQLVARLDLEVAEASAALALARAEASADLEMNRTRLTDAQRRLANLEKLHAEGIVTAEELALTQLDAKLAKLAVERSIEDRRVANLEAARAQAVVNAGAVRSPITGVVVERHLSPGEKLGIPGQESVLTLGCLDPLYAEVYAPASFFDQLSLGQRARIQLKLESRPTLSAEVIAIDRVIDTASDTFRVRLALPNPDNAVPAGLRCQVLFGD
jgi:RND family efflux transporter MFP subunit